MKSYVTLITVLFLTSITTQFGLAHSVYFEAMEDGQLVIRFGQFGDDYEESPGFLDSLDAIYCWKIGEENKPQALNPKKGNQGFSIEAKESDTTSAHSGFIIMTRGSSPARKPYFYARWAPDLKQKAEPTLTLDLTPTGVSGEVQAFFRQKPLIGAKATLYTPEANDQELTADEKGIFTFKTNPEEKGLYMLKIGRHREDLAGFDRGTAFELSSHNCSLTWEQ